MSDSVASESDRRRWASNCKLTRLITRRSVFGLNGYLFGRHRSTRIRSDISYFLTKSMEYLRRFFGTRFSNHHRHRPRLWPDGRFRSAASCQLRAESNWHIVAPGQHRTDYDPAGFPRSHLGETCAKKQFSEPVVQDISVSACQLSSIQACY
jgi:hypothetical protein